MCFGYVGRGRSDTTKGNGCGYVKLTILLLDNSIDDSFGTYKKYYPELSVISSVGSLVVVVMIFQN